MRITMQQIADIAGVTRATVDKVVHNRPGVRPATREHIQKILTEYNYQAAGTHTLPDSPVSKRLAVVTLPPSYDYYFQDLKNGMEKQLKMYQNSGLNTDYYYYDSADPESVLSTLSYLEGEPIDALAVRSVNYPGVSLCINRLVKRGIPVITFDSDLPDTERMCFIGEDLNRTGRISASLMAKLLNGQGKIAIIGSSLNTNSTFERFEGFLSLLAEEYPKIQVAEKLETLGQHSITYAKVRETLRKHPDLKGIWNAISCNEDMIQAISDAGRLGDLKIVSLTFSPSVISLVRQNKIDFTLGLAPEKIGELVIQTVYEYLYLLKRPDISHIKTPVHVALKENIDLFHSEK
ncbi:MAG: substrate-binding domain-containing protein [Ruminococcus sp.]|jgi:LacI family transcriptional regulator